MNVFYPNKYILNILYFLPGSVDLFWDVPCSLLDTYNFPSGEESYRATHSGLLA